MKSNTSLCKTRIITIIPLAFAIAIVPLIVFLKDVVIGQNIVPYWKGGNQNADFFSYWKMVYICFSAFASAIAVFYTYKKERFDSRDLKPLIPLFIYGIFLTVSTFLSKYSDVALFGFPDRHEGFLVLFSYIILLLSCYFIVQNNKQCEFLLGSLFISCIAVCIIGFFQFYGFDFFRSNFGKLIILPKEYHNIADSLNFAFGPKTIYSTLYNTNYVGSYMAMLLPLALTMYLHLSDKKSFCLKISTLTICLLIFFNLIGCNSRAGYIGAIFGFIFVCIFGYENILKKRKYFIPLFIGFVLIFIITNISAGGSITNRLKGTISELKISSSAVNQVDNTISSSAVNIDETMLKSGFVSGYDISIEGNKSKFKKGDIVLTLLKEPNTLYFIDSKENKMSIKFTEKKGQFIIADEVYKDFYFAVDKEILNVVVSGESILFKMLQNQLIPINGNGEQTILPQSKDTYVNTNSPRIKKFYLKDKYLIFESDSSLLKLYVSNGQIMFKDNNDVDLVLQILNNGKLFTFENSKYKDYIITPLGSGIIKINKGSSELNFALVDEKFKFVNGQGNLVDIVDVPKWGFEGKELMGSSRGYIWSRSIPLLKNTILNGYGPDTYAIYFPQNDYSGKNEFLGSTNMVVDKPHNMYLQMGINIGVIGLVAFIIGVVLHFIRSIKNLISHKEDEYIYLLNLGLSASLIGYLVSGLFNDSIVSVAPIFWVLFGLALGLNERIAREQH